MAVSVILDIGSGSQYRPPQGGSLEGGGVQVIKYDFL